MNSFMRDTKRMRHQVATMQLMLAALKALESVPEKELKERLDASITNLENQIRRYEIRIVELEETLTGR